MLKKIYYGKNVYDNKEINAVVKRSRTVAEKMSGGVQFLMKKNKIDVIMGTGKVIFESTPDEIKYPKPNTATTPKP